MVVGSRHVTVQNSIKEHQRIMIFDALLMMQQTEALRTERNRWEIDARFEHQSGISWTVDREKQKSKNPQESRIHAGFLRGRGSRT